MPTTCLSNDWSMDQAHYDDAHAHAHVQKCFSIWKLSRMRFAAFLFKIYDFFIRLDASIVRTCVVCFILIIILLPFYFLENLLGDLFIF